MIAKKTEFVELLQGLFLVKDLKGKKFSLVISKNITLIQDSIKDLEHKGKPSKEFVDLATKIRALSSDTSEEAKDKIKALEAENAAVIEERKTQIAEITLNLEEETELTLNTIKEVDLPEDISPEQILALSKIIE
jgi:gas vesicle protein